MILVDANLLLYAANQAAPEHRPAREWLDSRLSGTARVGLPWPSLLAFVRLAGPAWAPQPTSRHAEILGALFAPSSMTSRLVPDAHLAALAIEHGLTLCSTDGDFARFAGLDWQNPLAS